MADHPPHDLTAGTHRGTWKVQLLKLFEVRLDITTMVLLACTKYCFLNNSIRQDKINAVSNRVTSKSSPYE